MRIKVWRTKRAWRWYCPACDRTWSNHHRPQHVRPERLSPGDPRRVPAFQRTHTAVQRHLWRYHGGADIGGECHIPLVGGPRGGAVIYLPVASPVHLARIPVEGYLGAAYHLMYTADQNWFYRWDFEPMRHRTAGTT